MTDADSNAERLAWLVTTFSIPPAALQRYTHKSKAYIARLLSKKCRGTLAGSAEFYVAIERNLPAILEQRRKQLFNHPSVTQVQLQNLERLVVVEQRVA